MDRSIWIRLRGAPYRYFWLKYVDGFDAKVHCARCLIGNYSGLVNWRNPRLNEMLTKGVSGSMNEFQSEFVYLCGVDSRGYAYNLHLPMRTSPGEVVVYENDTIQVEAHGFSRVEIHKVPGAKDEVPWQFETCRNWQFGWEYFPGGRIPFDQIAGKVTSKTSPRKKDNFELLF